MKQLKAMQPYYSVKMLGTEASNGTLFTNLVLPKGRTLRASLKKALVYVT